MSAETAPVTTLAPRARGKQPGRTKLARVERAIALEQLERERKEGADRAPRFSAQHKFVLVLLLGLAALMATASFIVSFDGLAGAALWAVGDTWLRFIAPAMFDVAIIMFTLKLFRDREEGGPVRWAWFWIGVLALISASANILHTLSITSATTLPQLVMGCVISGGAPFLLALVSDVAADQVFKKPDAKS